MPKRLRFLAPLEMTAIVKLTGGWSPLHEKINPSRFDKIHLFHEHFFTQIFDNVRVRGVEAFLTRQSHGTIPRMTNGTAGTARPCLTTL